MLSTPLIKLFETDTLKAKKILSNQKIKEENRLRKEKLNKERRLEDKARFNLYAKIERKREEQKKAAQEKAK